MSSQSKQKKVKGNRQKLKLFRTKDPVTSILMWGIGYSMSQLAHVTRRAFLMDEDFRASIKVGIDNHQFSKDYLPSHFKFKEYAPMVFLDLRIRFGVNDRDYLNSFTAYSPARLKKSPKKYSSMLVSHNKQYTVKIISSDDVSVIQGFLADYHEHVVQSLAKTRLSQFLAMYRLTVNDQHTYIVVMKNMYYPPGEITRLYLLDGSIEKILDKEKVFKNNNIDTNCDELQWEAFGDASLTNDNVKMCISQEDRTELLQMLCNDMQFLESNKMKFKILLGLLDSEYKRFQRKEITSVPKPVLSEEEGEEDVMGVVASDERRVSFEMSPTESDHEVEGENDEERNTIGNVDVNHAGHYGIKDNIDPSIIYYIGIVSFFKKRHMHKPKERKPSVSVMSSANIKGEHPVLTRLDSAQVDSFVHAESNSGTGNVKLLSNRLLNTLTQIIE